MTPFSLSPKFLEPYKKRDPGFGFNGLGEVVFFRTYSRLKADGTNEQWWETVKRVVEGCFRMQQRHIDSLDLGWSDKRAQRSAQEMYERIFSMKFLPPGRGMWAMGSPITEERGLYAALNNCAFTSTANIDKELTEPFTFLMDASMLGIGVGFDTKGAGKLLIHKPHPVLDEHGEPGFSPDEFIFDVADSREGWVDSVRVLLESYFLPEWNTVHFDYSRVRPEGAPIKGFGGVSSGPGPLIKLHEQIRAILDRCVGRTLSSRDITDIMNCIGVCVVSGNVRRSAEIAFGDPNDDAFLNLKNYDLNPDRVEFGWASNNSIFAEIGMDYSKVASQTATNGEPGYFWLENARKFGRMGDPPNNLDKRVMGANPCVEQSLEDKELCCLVETFPDRHEDLADFLVTLKYAYLYAKTVTLGKTHWPKTNRVMLRNRRIGTSMSGISQFLSRHSMSELVEWCQAGYDEIAYYDKIYSEWLAVSYSIKTTSIKPSGSISLLPGATSGMHDPEDRYYVKGVFMAKNSQLVTRLRMAGYRVHQSAYAENDVFVEFPVYIGENVRVQSEVSMWEQLSRAALLQRYWADNQVSCTVTFDPVTEGRDIARALDIFQYQLKGISFLPRLAKGAFPQMPQRSISKDEYDLMVSELWPLDFSSLSEEGEQEKGCATDVCETKWKPGQDVA